MTIIPINYIALKEEHDEQVAYVAGTPLTVGEIAHMYFYGDSSVDWIVENFEILNPAQVYAALLYYYDHRDSIDAYMRRRSEIAESNADALLSDVIARMKKNDSA